MPEYLATIPKPPASTKWRKVEKSGEKWFPGALQDFPHPFRTPENARNGRKISLPEYPATIPKPPASTKWIKVEKSGEKWFPGALQEFPHPFRTPENSRNGRKISLPKFLATTPKPSASPKHKAEAQHPTVGGGKQQKTEWYENRRQRPGTQPPPQDGNPKSHPYHPGAQNSHAGIFFETGFEAWKFQNSSGKYKQLKLLCVFVCFLAARNFC